MGLDEDRDLASRIAAGDEHAATTFDQRVRRRIEAFVRKRGVSPEDSPDVAQDILVNALHQLRQGKFRGAATLATWLYPIVNAGVANHFRRRAQRETTATTTITSKKETPIATGDAHVTSAVNQALARLTPEERGLLLLHDREGLTLEEIAPILGRRKSAIAERLKKARENFRRALRGDGRTPRGTQLKE